MNKREEKNTRRRWNGKNMGFLSDGDPYVYICSCKRSNNRK